MKKFFRLLALLQTGLIYAGEVISLDKISMNVVETAANGVVNEETIFHFSQKEDVVTADYEGGKIQKGFLVGKRVGESLLVFSYCQMQLDGRLDNGCSQCEISKNENGEILLIEYFEWASRPGEYGVNILQELKPVPAS